MESSEMLDVIHVLFEDDVLPTWEHDQDIKGKVRKSIYRQMYKRDYKYGSASAEGRTSEWEFGDTPTYDPEFDGIYGPPTDGSIKPYIPPTDEDELFDIIGSPMGE